MNTKIKTTSATTTKNTDNIKTQKITRKKVRLLFSGGAKKDEDNITFLNAAQNVIKDYENDKRNDIEIKPLYEIEDAEFIINKIELQEDNSIESIDFFSHGSELALYVKRVFILGLNQSLYVNEVIEQEHKNILGEYSGNLSELNYSKFTNTTIVEIHGCNTGSIEEKNKNINFSMIFSKHLYDAGKTKSVVIGHVTKANPNQHKTLKGSDYRHGGRRVYHNGKELFFTRIEGRITSVMINCKL